MQQDLDRQQSQWQSTMGAILKRAESQWDSAFRSLDSQHMSWQSAFTRAYEDRAATWDASYVKLETGKADWVKAAAQKAATVGSQAVLSELGQSAEGAIRDASSLVVSDLGLAKPDARSAVAGVLQGKDFASLLASGKLLNRGISSGAVIFAQMGPDIFDNSLVLHRIASMNESSQEQIDKHVLMIAASQARKAVFDARDSMAEHIDKANQSVADGLERSLLQAGFVRSSDHFERQTVVDSTISGALKELHVVPAYEPYKLAGGITTNVDLSDARLESLSASGIQAQVQLAVTEMRGELTQVFGEDGAKGSVTITTWETKEWDESTTYETTYTDGNGRSHTVTQTGTIHHADRNQASAQADVGGGEFGVWVGVAPEMDQKTDGTAGKGEYSKYLSATGTGQMGDVLTPFMWSQMKEGVGWAMVAQPIYDQKLWDDRGSWVKAPTIRSVVDIGVSIAAAATGNVWAIAALNLADDAVFSLADISNGADAGQVALNFGKKAFTSFASAAIGGVFNGFQGVTEGFFQGGLMGTVTDQGIGGVIGKTMLSGLQGLSTNVVTGAVNSITYDSQHGFGFDNAAFTQSVVGQQALAGYLGSMASTATSGLLAGNLTGFSQLDKTSVLSVSNLGGSLVNAGVQYAMTGESTLNVLNWADLTGNRNWTTGMLEMHLGGKDGFSMNLGTGGTDVSLGTIGQAVSGLGTFAKQQQIRWYEATGGVDFAGGYSGNREVGTLLRENYSFGGEEARTQLNRLLGGQDSLRVGYIGSEGQTVASGTSRTVNLATLGMAGDIESQLAAGIVLGHEAYRNGIDDGALGQQYETQRAVLGHTQMALSVAQQYGPSFILGNQNLSSDVAAYLNGPQSFANYVGTSYDSSADYWKLMSNGDLVKDKDGWLKDENGNYIYRDGTRSKALDTKKAIGANGIETGLLNILFGGTSNKAYDKFSDDQVNEAQALMIGAHFQYTGGNEARSRMWTTGNDNRVIQSSAILEGFGDTVVAPVLMNGLDQLSDAAVFGGEQTGYLARSYVAQRALSRFDSFVAAKNQFYFGHHRIFDDSDLSQLQLGGTFRPAASYVDMGGQHGGVDYNGVVPGGALGINAYSLFSGEVTAEKLNTTSSGYSVVVEYGFNFEGSFYDTGVAAQFMHFQEESPLSVGNYLTGTTLVGKIGATDGGTGIVTGPHLHYQLMGDLGGRGLSPTSSEWDMYRYRRNTFLQFVGSNPMEDFSATPTSTQNYWAPDRRYRNYYFNTNDMMQRMGIYVGK